MNRRITVPTGSPYTKVMGLGVYRPSRVVSNAEICERIDSSDEWIRTRSGIIERRWATEDESLIDMSVAAARDAVKAAGITPEQVGVLIEATSTYLMNTPAGAVEIARQVGCTNAAAFDISAACAGFCHAVALGSDMIRAGTAEYVVVIGAEKLSTFTDQEDRSTAFIFADGAGAVVLGPSDVAGIGPVVWGTDGEQGDAIRQNKDFVTLINTGEPGYVRMDGQKVFRWAVYSMIPVARKALEAAGVTVDELDAFIPHQANLRIIDALARGLKLPESVAIARDIERQGNTSAASVPLAMHAMLESGEARSGDLALIMGFGAGLVYAAQVITLP
ncbi:MAG: beta-ketoacyl-ACP synthase III [Micromonosporaceae bacterium]